MRSLSARKVARLVDVIDDQRGQVRVAFATEVSKAVSTTVSDVLAALLGGRPTNKWHHGYGDHGPGHMGVDAGWDDQYQTSDPFDRYDDADEEDGTEPTTLVRPAAKLSTSSITLAVAAGSWLYRQSRSRLFGLAGTLAVGLAAVFGGPLTQSIVTVASAVHQLPGPGESLVLPVD